MEQITVASSLCSFNNTVCNMDRYIFSPAIILEFSQVHSRDNAEETHRGINQFRIDYTRIGRFECEFPDRSFSCRGENEITLLATPKSPDWVYNASIPTGVYHGCALIVFLDKLDSADNAFFERLGVGVNDLIDKMDIEQHWQKLINVKRLVELFEDIYSAHSVLNREILYLRSLEILLYISQNNCCNFTNRRKNDFYSAKQVRTVKQIHDFILSNYPQSISFEALVRDYDIGYSIFNKVFKTIYGESPYQYLKRIRINLAAQRLLETKMSILEICNSVGYDNPSKFSGAFKSVIGVLPRTFRKEKNGMEHLGA